MPRSAPVAAAHGDTTDERIAKVMARAGLCSRRDAEAWIAAGRVEVNGVRLMSPARNVGPNDSVLVDGRPLARRERTRLFLFHKPRGLVTTDRDPRNRPTIFSALPADMPRVVTIGRLDINTEGLLLLTNDGGLARVLELPATGWIRRYRVRANGTVDQAALDGLSRGITVDGVEYAGIAATLDRVQGANVWLTMALREGKNREVKRVLEHLGLAVNRLIRISFGPFQLGELAEGAVEEVRTRVLREQLGAALAEQAGVDFDSPSAKIVTLEEKERRRRARAEAQSLGEKNQTRNTRRSREDIEPPLKRRDRPKPGARKHVSALRREKAAANAQPILPRHRTELAETADRKGRAVAVERIVASPKGGESSSRNGRRFTRRDDGQQDVRSFRRKPSANETKGGSGTRAGRPTARKPSGGAPSGRGPRTRT